MARTYYTLVTRDTETGFKWFPQFGDYDRETVESEQQDYVDHGTRKADTKIVMSVSSKKRDVDAAITRLNMRTR